MACQCECVWKSVWLNLSAPVGSRINIAASDSDNPSLLTLVPNIYTLTIEVDKEMSVTDAGATDGRTEESAVAAPDSV